MLLNVLIILGACVAGFFLGESAYRIVIKVRKTLKANRRSSAKAEMPTLMTVAEDLGALLSESVSDETDRPPDIRRKADVQTGDDDLLNSGVSEASASAIKKADEDWLNAQVEEVSADVYRQRDEAWLNAQDGQLLGTPDESSSKHLAFKQPTVQFKQDGSTLNITVAASKKQDEDPEQSVINLKIKLSPQDLAKKGEGPYDIEITTEDSSTNDDGLGDFLIGQSDPDHSLMDEIFVRPVETPVVLTPRPIDEPDIGPGNDQITESRALMDEISVRAIDNPVVSTLRPNDQPHPAPANNEITESHALMDDVSVRLIARPVMLTTQLIDEPYVGPVDSQVGEAHGLLDEISIRPSPGPVAIEYQLLDDLITKRAVYRSRQAGDTITAGVGETTVEPAIPSIGTVMTNPTASAVDNAQSVKPVGLDEIAEMFEQRRKASQAAIPSGAAELRTMSPSAGVGESVGDLSGRSKALNETAGLRRPTIVPGTRHERPQKVKTVAPRVELRISWRYLMMLISPLCVVNLMLGALGYRDIQGYFLVNAATYFAVKLLFRDENDGTDRALQPLNVLVFVVFLALVAFRTRDYLRHLS